VFDRCILAAADRPEELVGERLAACGRRSVDRHQKTGRAIIVLDWVIERRQIEHRDVLHLEDGVLQEGVVIERERD
jgi:hypothetical protein